MTAECRAYQGKHPVWPKETRENSVIVQLLVVCGSVARCPLCAIWPEVTWYGRQLAPTGVRHT